MIRKLVALLISYMLISLPFNVAAVEDAIPWPDKDGEGKAVANIVYDDVVYDATAHSAEYGAISNMEDWGEYIVVVHEFALVFLDSSTYQVVKTWKIKNSHTENNPHTAVNLTGDCDCDYYKLFNPYNIIVEYTVDYSWGFRLLAVAKDDERIYVWYQSLNNDGNADAVSFFSTYENTLDKGLGIELIFDGYTAVKRKNWDVGGTLWNRYLVTSQPPEMQVRDGKLLTLQPALGSNSCILETISPATKPSAEGLDEYDTGYRSPNEDGGFKNWVMIAHLNAALTSKGFSGYEVKKDANAIGAGVIGDDYAYVILPAMGSTDKKIFLFVIDIRNVSDFDANTAIIAVKKIEVDNDNTVQLRDASLSGNILSFGIHASGLSYEEKNTYVIDVTTPTDPKQVDADIWAVSKSTDDPPLNDLYTIQTVNVFGSIIVTTMRGSNNIVKTLLDSEKKQLVQEMYTQYTDYDDNKATSGFSHYIQLYKAKWSKTDYFETCVSLATDSSLYLVSGKYKLIKMTYLDPNILDKTKVDAPVFSKTSVSAGEITASIDYEIGRDKKSVMLVVAKFKKSTRGLIYDDLKQVSTGSNLKAGDKGKLISEAFDIASNEVGSIVFKAYVWNGFRTLTPNDDVSTPTILGQ